MIEIILPQDGFKPYYNWNTFNTGEDGSVALDIVLNLIITGIPSIHFYDYQGVEWEADLF